MKGLEEEEQQKLLILVSLFCFVVACLAARAIQVPMPES